MRTGPAAPAPTLSAGSLGTVTACNRRLARHLDPQDRPRSPVNEGRFRLGRAIADAIRAAHDTADANGETDFDAILDRTPPTDLGHEEARRFITALDHYAELAEQRPGHLHPRAGDSQTRPSPDGTWALRAELGLLIEAADGGLELRRVTVGPVSGQGAVVHDSDLARIALLGAEAVERAVRVVRLWTEGTAHVTVRPVDAAMLTAMRHRLVATVDAARTEPEAVTPGWWCTTCPCIPGCPAIPATRLDRLLT